MSEIDINKIVLWNAFKEKLIEKINNSDPFQVDLNFEFRDLSGRIHTYSSNDDVYISDILIDRNGKMIFAVPEGSGYKYFSLADADCIASPELGSFLDVIRDSYSAAFTEVGVTEYPNDISAFLDDMLADKSSLKKLIEIMNNSSEHIRKQIEAEQNKKSFAQIKDFGLF